MKKLIFIISFLLCVTLNSVAQVKGSAYFDGYWSKWEYLGSNVELEGGYRGFIIYLEEEGPWHYRFKFTINNFQVPNKKQRKKDIKLDKWYEYSGTVEYYISDDDPSVLAIFRKKKGVYFIASTLKNGRPTKKITSKATIKIAPFKDLPNTYNIWFDGVGFAISLNGGSFPNEKFY
mgnify:FL=1